MVGTPPRVRFMRRCSRWRTSFFSCDSRWLTRSFARRRPISSLVSPGPRPPMPPVRRERESSFCARRGMLYFSCASSTCSLPSRLSARCAKMSRISWVRSMTLRSLSFAIDESCTGVRSRSKISTCASSCMARTITSSSLPLPRTCLGSMRSRTCTMVSTTSTPAVYASSRSSRIPSFARRSASRSDLSPTWSRMARPSFAWTSRVRVLRANSASRPDMSSATSTSTWPGGSGPTSR